MGPTQLAEVLRQLPSSVDPNLLVGFENSDDAGVLRLSEELSLVQTVDFFTPVVDDPYSYGAIAAANALSDVYAMGGRPISVLNIACFSPDSAPADVWAAVLRGAFDKTVEAGAVVMGGHSVQDPEPKFGMAVTGLVNPSHMFVNTEAKVGDAIFLTKPLGSGIITTAAKNDLATPEEISEAIRWMSQLNDSACKAGLDAGVRCATDITGFGLVGHLWNVARASKVRIRIATSKLPLLPGVERLLGLGQMTGGGSRNAEFVGSSFKQLVSLDNETISSWMRHLVFDPQTSGGLALFSMVPPSVGEYIGEVIPGDPAIEVSI